MQAIDPIMLALLGFVLLFVPITGGLMAATPYLMPKRECFAVEPILLFGSHEDLERMAAVVREHELATRCQVYISPVFGAIEPAAIVDFMRERSLTHARLQLQLHKFIWPNQERGV